MSHCNGFTVSMAQVVCVRKIMRCKDMYHTVELSNSMVTEIPRGSPEWRRLDNLGPIDFGKECEGN